MWMVWSISQTNMRQESPSVCIESNDLSLIFLNGNSRENKKSEPKFGGFRNNSYFCGKKHILTYGSHGLEFRSVKRALEKQDIAGEI